MLMQVVVDSPHLA